MGKKLAGTCFVKVNGQQLELQGNIEFPLTSVQRETMLSTTGVTRKQLSLRMSAATSLFRLASRSKTSRKTRHRRLLLNAPMAWSTPCPTRTSPT
mgnify:CR=1 FL=1